MQPLRKSICGRVDVYSVLLDLERLIILMVNVDTRVYRAHGLGRTRRESADCNSRERLGRGLGLVVLERVCVVGWDGVCV